MITMVFCIIFDHWLHLKHFPASPRFLFRSCIFQVRILFLNYIWWQINNFPISLLRLISPSFIQDHIHQKLLHIQLLQFFQLKRFSILFSYITTMLQNALKILCQVEKFLIFFIVIKRYYWNSILKLIAKAIHSVVNYDQICKRSAISENPEIFDIKSIWHASAMIPIKACIN